jgi:hypothetical protein
MIKKQCKKKNEFFLSLNDYHNVEIKVGVDDGDGWW